MNAFLKTFTLLGATLLALLAHASVQTTPVDASDGAVFASLPGGKPSDILILQSTGVQKADYTIPTRATLDGIAFGARVPRGEYKLLAVRGSLLSSNYPVVKVETGRMTDMGTLVFVNAGDNRNVLFPTRNAQSSRNMEAARRELGAPFSANEPVVWLSDMVPNPLRLKENFGMRFGLMADLKKAYESRVTAEPVFSIYRDGVSIDAFLSAAKKAARPATKKPVEDAQGRMFFGAPLGQVRLRDAGGVWSALDTGCLHTVTAVEWWGSRLLAGFDNGEIRQSLDDGKTWNVVASLESMTAVIDISRLADQWFITTARSITLRNGLDSVDQISVYSALKDDLTDIIKNRDFTVDKEPFVTPSAKSHKNFLYVNAFLKLWRMDAATMQWRAVGPDTDLHGFQVAPDSGALAAYRIKGAFSKLFVSADHGETWSKYDNPPYVIMDIRFTGPNQGQTARWNMSAFSGAIELLQYDKSRDNWTKSGDAPAGCNLAFADKTHAVKLCVTPGGNILSNADGKWAIEFAAE